jgi:hypothetical protein
MVALVPNAKLNIAICVSTLVTLVHRVGQLVVNLAGKIKQAAAFLVVESWTLKHAATL